MTMTLRRAAIRLDVLVDDLLQRILVGKAYDLLDDLPTFEQQQRRNASDAESAGDARVVVDVELSDRDASIVIGSEFVNGRAQPFAGAAPLSPEIHQHRLGGFDDGLLEIG